MYYSKLFTKTLKQAPKDAETVNQILLTRAGFVEQLMAGVYSYLPLGLRVLRNIEEIVRTEMNNVGALEVLMPMLHPKEIWEKTGGWENIDVLFKIKSRTGKEYALGQSEEEVVAPLVLGRVSSYRDLPIAVYQINWKFRDELRAKSGILRGREFLMKDMYSFHETEEDFQKFYEVVKKAYLKIFEKLGLIAKVTEASGGAFSKKISYEFMVLSEVGEDEIFYCPACDFCVNKEISDLSLGTLCHRCGVGKLLLGKAVEAGNVFDLGQKYGKDFGLTFVGRDGKPHIPFEGCYGIGISRAMGIIVEKFHDDKGIIWPESVAPFKVNLVGLDLETEEVYNFAERIYQGLVSEGIEVLFDDRRDLSAGQKFADADLIGIPYRVVVSKRTLAPEKGQLLEVKKRSESATQFLGLEELVKNLKSS